MSPAPSTPVTDDELGSALGRSVRHRADVEPPITPPFDRIERRARQITNRRRAVAGVCAGAVALLGGIGITSVLAGREPAGELDVVTRPEPAPIDEPAPVPDPADDEPPLLDTPLPATAIGIIGLIDDQQLVGITGVEGATPRTLLTVTGDERITKAIVLADGSILATVTDALVQPMRRVLHYAEAGATPTVLSENGFLAGGAVIDGIPYAYVGDAVVVDESFGFEPTALRRIDLSTGTSADLLEQAFGTEWQISAVEVHGDELLYVDLSEGGWTWFRTDLDASDRLPIRSGRWSDDVWPTAPRFASDGDGYWWAERDISTGSWVLVRADPDLTERERIPLDIGTDRTDLSLQVEVGDEQLAINIIGDPEAAPLDHTTIWVDPRTGATSLEAEPGLIGFVQPPQAG